MRLIMEFWFSDLRKKWTVGFGEVNRQVLIDILIFQKKRRTVEGELNLEIGGYYMILKKYSDLMRMNT